LVAEPLRQLVLATTNRGKLADFRMLFAGSPIELVSVSDTGLQMEVEETGATFEQNALLKARAIAAATSAPTLADDSGLEVYALGGQPGIHSARYAGVQGDDYANNVKLLEHLRGVTERRAAFVCVLALVLPRPAAGALEIVAEGRCEGRIIEEERGSNGFGYDAVFFRDDLGCTFGEASPQEKNARSHRAAAVRALLAEIGRRGLAPG
jgi:XTP/dITP diphosphohydrolase